MPILLVVLLLVFAVEMCGPLASPSTHDEPLPSPSITASSRR